MNEQELYKNVSGEIHFNFETLTEKAAGKLEVPEDFIAVSGLANTAAKDRHSDIILPKAWSKQTLAAFKKNPVLLYRHTDVIGRVASISSTDKGLEVVAFISKNWTELWKVEQKLVKAFSVGIRILEASWDEVLETFFIKKLELLEISVVPIPANRQSLFSLSKDYSNEERTAIFKHFKTQDDMKFKSIEEASEFFKSIGNAIKAKFGIDTITDDSTPEELKEAVDGLKSPADIKAELKEELTTEIKAAIKADADKAVEDAAKEAKRIADLAVKAAENANKSVEDRLKAIEEKATDVDVETQKTLADLKAAKEAAELKATNLATEMAKLKGKDGLKAEDGKGPRKVEVTGDDAFVDHRGAVTVIGTSKY